MSLEMKSVKFTYKKINKKENRRLVSNYVKNFVTDPKTAKRILKNMGDLVPYVDYMPIKMSSGKQTSKITDKSITEMMIEDSPFKTWADLGEMARPLYDTKEEALEILIKGSRLFKLTDDNTFMLCALLEAEAKKKKNKDLKFQAVVETVFDQCCTFIKIDPTRVNPSKSKARRDNVRMNPNYLNRQTIVNRIIEKYRRLVKKKPKEFREWKLSHGQDRLKFNKKKKK